MSKREVDFLLSFHGWKAFLAWHHWWMLKMAVCTLHVAENRAKSAFNKPSVLLVARLHQALGLHWPDFRRACNWRQNWWLLLLRCLTDAGGLPWCHLSYHWWWCLYGTTSIAALAGQDSVLASTHRARQTIEIENYETPTFKDSGVVASECSWLSNNGAWRTWKQRLIDT